MLFLKHFTVKRHEPNLLLLLNLETNYFMRMHFDWPPVVQLGSLLLILSRYQRIIGTLRRRRQGRRPIKMCLYFTLEFRIYLELPSVYVRIKTCLYWICCECVQFQKDIPKLSRCSSRFPDNTEFGHFTWLLCTGRQRNAPRIITHVQSRCFAY